MPALLDGFAGLHLECCACHLLEGLRLVHLLLVGQGSNPHRLRSCLPRCAAGYGPWQDGAFDREPLVCTDGKLAGPASFECRAAGCTAPAGVENYGDCLDGFYGAPF